MAHLYKTTEWECNGLWMCGDVSHLSAMSNTWWYPCNILKIKPVEYVKMLINDFHAINLHYTVDANVLIFYFASQADCRKYKNFINRKAREVNFLIS